MSIYRRNIVAVGRFIDRTQTTSVPYQRLHKTQLSLAKSNDQLNQRPSKNQEKLPRPSNFQLSRFLNQLSQIWIKAETVIYKDIINKSNFVGLASEWIYYFPTHRRVFGFARINFLAIVVWFRFAHPSIYLISGILIKFLVAMQAITMVGC